MTITDLTHVVLCYLEAMRTGDLYQRYHGLYIGTVTDVKDPQKLGRIRIQCDQYEDKDDEDALWAPVARPAVGGTSVFFTPNVGDQVIFGFHVGDVNGPVVLGYAHNTSGQPVPDPLSADSPKNHGIVTKIGSVVFFEDDNKIEVKFGDSTTITMDSGGITLNTEQQVKVIAQNVFVGSGDANQPIPLGTMLQTWLDAHIHPTAMGPSGPPTPATPFPSQQYLSTKNTVD